ncbi:serine hydrolase-domain-containing protein [Coniochaeta sp. 2T2.1]|nr:serine hydrolase-domain-containing protein [Coniochaeta sp. 2T2.1]
MKVLCLHGQGTSGAIFESQTAAFRSKLGPSYTFDFPDAPFPCAPAPGIKALYATGGTYTWWPQPTVSLIRGSHQRLLDHIAESGPYDALCCFSQGCALAFSFLLYHARESPEPLPFKSVIFICGGVPFPVLEDLGYKVSDRARHVDKETVRIMKAKAARLGYMASNLGEIRRGEGLWDDTSDLIHDPGRMPEEEEGGGDVFGIDFGSVPGDMGIRGIETVHVFGAKDPRWPSSVQLAYFCEKERRVVYDHGGGHDIPRSTEVSERIAELVRGLPGGEKG